MEEWVNYVRDEIAPTIAPTQGTTIPLLGCLSAKDDAHVTANCIAPAQMSPQWRLLMAAFAVDTDEDRAAYLARYDEIGRHVPIALPPDSVLITNCDALCSALEHLVCLMDLDFGDEELFFFAFERPGDQRWFYFGIDPVPAAAVPEKWQRIINEIKAHTI